MRILIVVPAQDAATGNQVTAERFRAGLERRGHSVRLVSTGLDPALLDTALTAESPEVALLLHAWRSGKPWLECPASHAVPTLLLLTGTDLNQGLDDPVQAPVIRTMLARSRGVLLQNPLLLDQLRRRQPQLAARLHELPPGIALGHAPWPLREQFGMPADSLLLFCPAGLRPVKGLIELLEMCDPLLPSVPSARLLFCGPPLDAEYSRTLLTAIAQHPWARYLGVIPPDAMASAMAEVDLVLNNSRHEGLPNALLEATVLGKPILARNIPGNAAVVHDGVNGLLYTDPASFRAAATRLLTEPALRRQLSRPCPNCFTAEAEAESLERLLLQAVTA